MAERLPYTLKVRERTEDYATQFPYWVELFDCAGRRVDAEVTATVWGARLWGRRKAWALRRKEAKRARHKASLVKREPFRLEEEV